MRSYRRPRPAKPRREGRKSRPYFNYNCTICRRELLPCIVLLGMFSFISTHIMHIEVLSLSEASASKGKVDCGSNSVLKYQSQAVSNPNKASFIVEQARNLLRVSRMPSTAPSTSAPSAPSAQVLVRLAPAPVAFASSTHLLSPQLPQDRQKLQSLSSQPESTAGTEATMLTPIAKLGHKTAAPQQQVSRPSGNVGTHHQGTSRLYPPVLFEDHHDQYSLTHGHFIKRFFNPKEHRTVEQTQEILYDILVFARQTCQALGVHFQLKSGTLLGAWRHHAVIPWDVDVDILFTSKEVEKLKLGLRTTYDVAQHPSASEYQWIVRKGIHSDIIAIKLAHISSGLYVDCFVAFPIETRNGVCWEDRWLAPGKTGCAYPNSSLFPSRPCVFGTTTRRAVFDCPRDPMFMFNELYNKKINVTDEARQEYPVLIEFTRIAASVEEAGLLLSKAKAKVRKDQERNKPGHVDAAWREKIAKVLDPTVDDWSFYVKRARI